MPREISSAFSIALMACFASTAYSLNPRLTLLPPVPRVNGEFGSSMAELGDEILVGAGTTAHIFDRNDGSLLFTIPNPNPTPQALFGLSATTFHDEFVVSGISGGF